MAKTPATFDVWLLAANQVYKGVPFQVVAGWAEQGRLGRADKVRAAGTVEAWTPVASHPLLADYLTPPQTAAVAMPVLQTSAATQHPLDTPEPDALPIRRDDDDDDVDMIPLIDISLVLLIFFMMTTAVAAFSPISVPNLKNGAEVSNEDEALTVMIDRRANGEAFYGIAVGKATAAKENNNLNNLKELAARLDAVLGDAKQPPQVRIACHQELKRVLLREVAEELEKRRRAGKIIGYSAEVNEAKK